MKVIKYVLLLLFLVLIGGGLYILISDKEYTLEEGITMEAPRELVFEQVKDLEAWKNWISVDQKDLNLSFSKKKDTEQSYLTWDNTSAKEEGKLTHKSITHYSTIKQEGRSESGWGSRTQYDVDWNFHKIGNDSTRVDLSIKAKPNYLSKVKMALGYDDNEAFIESRSITSLQNIKKRVGEAMAAYEMTVEGIIRKNGPQNYLYKTEASINEPDIVMKKRNEILKLLKGQIDSLHIATKGNPIMVYNTIDKKHKNLIFSAGYPISSKVDTGVIQDEDIVIGSLEAEEYLKATLQGNYTNIPKLWEKAKAYMLKNDLDEDPENAAYEVFKITASKTKNPADWVTELYIPIHKKEISTVEEINDRLN